MSDEVLLAEIVAEIARARGLFPGQERTVSPAKWLGILVEEVGEVARDLNELLLNETTPEEFRDHVRVELVQVAAMAFLMASAVEVQS